MSSSEFFTDIFEEEARCVGKALLAVTAVGYLASQADGSTLFGRDDVQYAIDAYLPQGYDRGIMASRANQRLAKNLIVKRLQINTVKEQVRVAAGREAKLSGLFELFTLSLAGILSAAHVHSLIITLHVIKNMTLVLVYVLRKREAKQGSRGGTVVSTLRSWWSGGTQNFIMKAFVEKLQQHLEKSPFAQNMDEDTMGVGDGPRCLSVEAILKLTIPRCVDAAIQAVKTALNRRAPHVFSVTGIVTGRDVRELLDELSQDFESHLMWLDWLTPKPSSPSSSALLFSTQEQLLSLGRATVESNTRRMRSHPIQMLTTMSLTSLRDQLRCCRIVFPRQNECSGIVPFWRLCLALHRRRVQRHVPPARRSCAASNWLGISRRVSFSN
ncbi:hypothetical protein C4B63_40g48 [Trypanosoma cruzi]|uniref:Uncharacterized protein n=1 Tax=Trypanosoma cruzi TaxID=5693 RepID=A0A2V2V6Z0_TRYCR|nr:hypothetical protein C4B63_40g48 [Trypanosoma cruzi]